MGEREGGRGREGGGGRKSNRCVNAFLLECTVYHKTHTHTQHTWSPQFDSKLAKSVVPMYVLHPKICAAHKHVHPCLQCDVGEGREGEGGGGE